MCCAALAIQFHSRDPDLLLASWGNSDLTVEAREDERVEDISMMRNEKGGDMVEERVRGVFIHLVTYL
jgi:hypothetical protein